MNRLFTKQSFFYTFIFCLFGWSLPAQVFVDADATGNNDGSSWANAYTDLQAALNNTASGEIWVAGGTYLPNGGTFLDSAAFIVSSNVALYGSFAGTETSVDERDFSGTSTTLSADFGANDDATDVEANRNDNSFTVLQIDSLLAPVVIDGFIISGGTGSTDDLPLPHIAGGGIFAYSTVLINNCNIVNNSATFGGGIFLLGAGCDDSRITNTTINTNLADVGSAGYIFSVADVLVETIDISANELRANGNGGLQVEGCLNFTARNSQFVGNLAAASETDGGFGAAMFIDNSPGTLLRGCRFAANTSNTSGGAIYATGGDFEDLSILTIDSCEFSGNTGLFGGAIISFDAYNTVIRNSLFSRNTANGTCGAYLAFGDVDLQVENTAFTGNTSNDGDAGAIYLLNATADISDSDFENNSTTVYGGAISADRDDVTIFNDFTLTNCNFKSNQAAIFGGAIWYRGTENGEFINCTFEDNTTADGGAGGAVIAAFVEASNFTNCLFTKNSAPDGGAVYVFNGGDEPANFKNCTFSENNATSDNADGGAMLLIGGVNNIDSCVFSSNASQFFGGAISMYNDSLAVGPSTITKSTFVLNSADEQGGAINIGNVETVITNSLFDSNGAGGPGRGGAISNNASFGGESEVSELTVINSTFVGNLGTESNAIIQYELDDDPELTDSSAVAILNIQNNIFADGVTYADEAGTPTVNSLGGNLLLEDMDNLASLLATSDIIGGNVDDIFEDALNGDYRIKEGSAADEAGVAAGAPEVDILCLSRGTTPDIGAFENDIIISTETVIDNSALQLEPNPAAEFTRINIDNDWRGDTEIRIMNNLGQQIYQAQFFKAGDEQFVRLDLRQLTPGTYQIVLANQGQIMVKTLMKH